MQKEDIIKLPELGEGVTEGELVKWLVSKGENLKMDQPVAEVMTDKAVMEIPSPLEGVVESFFAKEGDTIPVGQKLLKLNPTSRGQASPVEKRATDEGSTTLKEEVKHEHPTNEGQASPVEKRATEEVSPTSSAKASHPIKASPFTRQWAKKLKVDLQQVKGSGADGRITQQDVLQYSTSPSKTKPLGKAEHLEQVSPTSQAPLASMSKSPSHQWGFEVLKEEGQERQALKGIRKKIAQKMQASKAVIPHFTLLESAEVDQLEKLKSSVKESLKEKNIKVTYLSFVMKALLNTLKEFPTLNASIDDMAQEIVYKHYYHFGFAVDTPRGLLVPVIKDVDKKSLAKLSYEIQSLAEKARQGDIKTEDMKGGTITITNIGSLGGEYATPIINAPESAILGMYRIFVKACWDGSKFVPKKTMNFSLTCDHRLIDGAVSARALKHFIHKIENPLSLFI